MHSNLTAIKSINQTLSLKKGMTPEFKLPIRFTGGFASRAIWQI
jgi:hypothetical protein